MTERTESSSARASTLTRQTRSAASAYVGEITASTAQTSTARLISNSPFVALLHLTTPHEECPRRVCAVTRRRFPVGASPTRQTLQPEATGAAMEVTKWLKPSESASRIGDRARGGRPKSALSRDGLNVSVGSKGDIRNERGRQLRRPYVAGGPVLRSWETAVTSCAGANGLVNRTLFGTPCDAHWSAWAAVM